MQVPGRDDSRLVALPDQARHVPWAPGVLAGIGTALGGYVAMFALLAGTGAIDFGRSVVGILRSVGLLFYNAHNVPTYERQRQTVEQDGEVVGEIVRESWRNAITGWRRVSVERVVDGEVVRDATQTVVASNSPALPPIVYFAVPVVVLLGAAAAFTYWQVDASPTLSIADAAVTSVGVAAAVALGYLLVVLLGTYVLAVSGATEGTFLRPARLEALGYGVAYPFLATAVSAGLVLGRRSTPAAGDQ